MLPSPTQTGAMPGQITTQNHYRQTSVNVNPVKLHACVCGQYIAVVDGLRLGALMQWRNGYGSIIDAVRLRAGTALVFTNGAISYENAIDGLRATCATNHTCHTASVQAALRPKHFSRGTRKPCNRHRKRQTFSSKNQLQTLSTAHITALSRERATRYAPGPKSHCLTASATNFTRLVTLQIGTGKLYQAHRIRFCHKRHEASNDCKKAPAVCTRHVVFGSDLLTSFKVLAAG